MKASEKAARERLKELGHTNGDGRNVDGLGAETYKQGPLSRLLGGTPKRKS